jgi:TRAP-type transport system small permease protein
VLVPARVRNRLEILIYALVGAFGAIMAWNGAILAASVAPYKIPTLGLSEAFNQAPLVISGALILLFSIEHVIALIRGEEVKPAWH